MTGYSAYWIGQVARRYHDEGEDGLVNHRRRAHRPARRPRPHMLLPTPSGPRGVACGAPGASAAERCMEQPHGGGVAERACRAPGERACGVALFAAARLHPPSAATAAYQGGQPPGARRLEKKLETKIAAVHEAHPSAAVEAWASDEHRIGLKPILRTCVGAAGTAAGGHDPPPLPLALLVCLCPSRLRAHAVASGLEHQRGALHPLAGRLCVAGRSRSWQRDRAGGGPGRVAHESAAARPSHTCIWCPCLLSPRNCDLPQRAAVLVEYPTGQPATSRSRRTGHAPAGPLRRAADRSRPESDHPNSYALLTCGLLKKKFLHPPEP